MKRLIGLITCLFMLAPPAAAQIKGQSEQDAAPETIGTNLTWNISFNPAVGNDLDISDDRITDENTVSANLGLRHNFPSRTYLTAKAGLEANPELISHIDIPGGAAILELQIGQRLLLGSPADEEDNRDSIDVHASYEFRHGFENDDDVRSDFSDHQFGIEATYNNIFWLLRRRRIVGDRPEEEVLPGRAVKVTAGWAFVDSNLPSREKDVITATAELTQPVLGFPDLAFEAAYERSLYDEPVGGVRRRDHTASVYAGLDLTETLKRLPRLDEALVGVRLSQNFSTIDAEDDTSIQLQLVLAFGGTTALNRR
jgi:hypothetical protein